MSHAYTPGLKVSRRMTLRCRRALPIRGEVLVNKGDSVRARDVVAIASMPGDVIPINVAKLLALSPSDVPSCMKKRQGERVEVGDVLAESKGIFGLFKSEYRSKSAGTIESISGVTGQVILRGEPQPIKVDAYVTGRVVELHADEGCDVEAEVAYVQGIFGVGGEAFGPIRVACAAPKQELAADLVTSAMKGAVLLGGARVTADALAKAVEIGASAIVTGGIDDEDLKNFLGYDLGVAITGSEQVGLTLVITEGFGDIGMADRTWKLIESHQGREASVNGATQIRAGVMRPEVVIPLGAPDEHAAAEATIVAGALSVGRTLRIIRDPYFGLLGTVADLPQEPRVLPSGSKARVVAVELESGERVVVPRANVELIEQ
jgi:hypothetical protein